MLKKVLFLLSIPFLLHAYKLDLLNYKQEKYTTFVQESFDSSMENATCTMRSNNYVTQQELLYLLYSGNERILTSKAIERFLWFVHNKHCFKSVELHYDTNNQMLTFDFDPLWVVKTVTLSGVSSRKQTYLNVYGATAGIAFSQEGHAESLERLQQFLFKQGYKNAHVTAEYTSTQEDKTVTVALHINKGQRFKIKNVSLRLLCQQESMEQQADQLAALYLNRCIGSWYDEEKLVKKIKQLKKALLDDGYFQSKITMKETLDREQHEVSVHFSVKIPPQQHVIFLGNRFFSKEKLNATIKALSSSFSALPITFFSQKIKKQYEQHGFFDVAIEAKEEQGKKYFIIQEGQRAFVDTLIVKGLPDELKNYAFRCGKSLQHTFYNQAAIDAYVKRITQRMYKVGYFHVVLLHQNIKKKTDGTYSLTLVFEPGKQEWYCGATVDDVCLESKLPYARYVGPFHYDIITSQSRWLSEYYKRKGFYNCKITHDLVDTQEGNAIHWHVKKDANNTYGKVVVQGVSSVDYSQLMQVFSYKEGRPFKKEYVKHMYTHLKSTQVFNQIRLYTQRYDDENQEHAFIFLQDEQPCEVRLRSGFQQVSKNFALKKGSTYSVGTSFLLRNVTRKADLFTFNADLTKFERVIDCSYHVPTFFEFPLFTIFKTYSNSYTQPLAAGSRKTLYKVTQEGLLMSMLYKTADVSTGFSTGFEWMETKDIAQDLADVLNFAPALIDKKIPYFFLEGNYFVERLDDKINPKKGVFSLLSCKGMFPLQHESSFLLKVLVEGGFFYPITTSEEHSIGVKIKAGHIIKESFAHIMPPERFYLGGGNSLRGYLPDSCPPLGTYIDEQNKTHRIPQGGKSLLNAMVELRLKMSQNLGIVLFQDCGILEESVMHNVSNVNKLAATGCGLRYQTPLGPLRFDIGFKWKKPFPEDARYAWFLTFGHAF